MKRELRWKKGQESNTEKTEESDTQDCKGSASQENKTQVPEQEAGGWKCLGRIQLLWENIHLWLYIYVCVLIESVTVTHISDFCFMGMLSVWYLHKDADCLHEVQLQHTCTDIKDKKTRFCTHSNPIAALTRLCSLFVSMLNNAWARVPALLQTSTSPLLSFRWNAASLLFKCTGWSAKHNSPGKRNIRSLGQKAAEYG